MPDLTNTPLEDLSVLDLRGADVIPFLQGQVSHDVNLLAGRGGLLAALHSRQGRVLALLRLLQVAPDHVMLVLPAELAGPTRQLLQKFVLRSRVKIADTDATWRVYGITGPDAAAAASTRICMAMDAGGWRQLVVAPRVEPLPEADTASRDSWRLADIEAGVPEVLAATSGAFVAQMLNLDLIDAISFSKGCYTGQEVVARAHYLGQVKRRMQRFFTAATVELAPGARVQLEDGRTAQIVTSARDEEAGQQFLAVTRLAGNTAEAATATRPENMLRIDSVALPLPYPLPQ